MSNEKCNRFQFSSQNNTKQGLFDFSEPVSNFKFFNNVFVRKIIVAKKIDVQYLFNKSSLTKYESLKANMGRCSDYFGA